MEKYYWTVPMIMLIGAVAADSSGTIVGFGFGALLTIFAAMEFRAWRVLRSIEAARRERQSD